MKYLQCCSDCVGQHPWGNISLAICYNEVTSVYSTATCRTQQPTKGDLSSANRQGVYSRQQLLGKIRNAL